MTSIAFIGLGNMGSGMCANLAQAGHAVRAFDLDAQAVDAAVAKGASRAASIAEAVAEVDVVVTMLPAGKHVFDVYFGEHGVATHASSDALLIDCSTISVDEAREAGRRTGAAGFEMVDAPVSGGTAAAQAGTLTFMVGGAQSAYRRATPILNAMGANVVHAGGSGNGQAAKIANNMLLGVTMIGTCEAFQLAESLGLDAQTFFDISSKASGQSWSMTSYCPAPGPVPAAPSNNDYKAGFAVDMMLKDLRLAQDASGAVNVATELGKFAEEFYARLSEDGHGGMDFSAAMLKLKGRL